MGSVKKFAMIATDITEQIATGAYRPGDRLPTIPELCEHYGVSKITVKRAMDRLSVRGLIARRRGSGTYVKDVPSTLDLPQGELHAITFKLHAFEVRHPSVTAAQSLRLDEGEFVFAVHRTRHEDGVPKADERLFLPIRMVPRLQEDQIRTDFIPHLEDEYGLHTASVNQCARAVRPDRDSMHALGVSASTPLLEVEYTLFLDDGRPYLHALVRHMPGYELRTSQVM